VRIRVEAVGLNRAEAMYRAGRYPVPCELPSRMGYEGVGTIEALGAGSTASPSASGSACCR
jgi:NADPH:quinone reductase-like Zn-dependent oxidoreductase